MVQSIQKTSGWSPKRRARHAEAIRRWAPWKKSTGPKTTSGKARSAQNACKHGRRALSRRLLDQALAAQNGCLRVARAFAMMRKLNPSNELLARLRARFYMLDRIFQVKLYQSLHHGVLCKNLAFYDPLGQIVNASSVHSTRRNAAGMTGTVLKTLPSARRSAATVADDGITTGSNDNG
jgi:hypothetical protein